MRPESIIEFEFSPRCTAYSTLTLQNIVNINIAFKVKTTAPKSYIVKPNQGILAPNESRELTITMQPLPDFPGEVNHRFQVQSAPISLAADHQEELTKFWAGNPYQCINNKLSVLISDNLKYQTSSAFQSIATESKIERSESIKNEIKDLSEFHDKQENLKRKMEEEYCVLLEQQKSRDEEINKLEVEGLKGYGSLHLVLVCFLGILVGYLYAIARS